MTKSQKPPRSFDARHPLESFDPRYRDLLRSALQHEIKLQFNSPGEAKHFQTRIQMFRKRLTDARDPDGKTFYRLKTSRKDSTVRIYLADAQFEQIFEHFTQMPHENLVPDDSENPTMPTPTPKVYDMDEATSSMTFDDLFADLRQTDEPDIPDEENI